MRKVTIQTCFILLFVSLAGVGVLHELDITPFEPLAGAEKKVAYVPLNWESWSSTQFQSQTEAVYKNGLSTRPAFIRTYNEFHYRLFGKTDTYVLIGKNNQYFAYNYFPSFRGFDYAGDEFWEKRMRGYEKLRDTLSSQGIPLLLVIAPNKVRYMPENLPDDLVKHPGKVTNQNTMVRLCREKEIPLLDLNSWFITLKDTVKHPLFPNSGSHWSGYGAILGMDTIMGTLEVSLDTNLADIIMSDFVHIPDSFLSSDRDMTHGLNLWTELPTEKLYYPTVEFDFSEAFLPNVLVIGDSYYWGIENLHLHQVFSADYSFWYYNATNYDSGYGEIPVDELSRWDEILKRNAVIIIGTESNLADMPFGLLEDLGLTD